MVRTTVEQMHEWERWEKAEKRPGGKVIDSCRKIVNGNARKWAP